MPPRRRTTADTDSSYDGVPTVNVILDGEPSAAEQEPELPLEVVTVPALDNGDTADAGDGEA